MPPWIYRAIPFRNNEPSKCKRYKTLENPSLWHDGCAASFSEDEEEKCDDLVFETKTVNVVNEVPVEAILTNLSIQFLARQIG